MVPKRGQGPQKHDLGTKLVAKRCKTNLNLLKVVQNHENYPKMVSKGNQNEQKTINLHHPIRIYVRYEVLLQGNKGGMSFWF